MHLNHITIIIVTTTIIIFTVPIPSATTITSSRHYTPAKCGGSGRSPFRRRPRVSGRRL